MKRCMVNWIALTALVAPVFLFGATVAPEDPPFEVLLKAHPVVVQVGQPELMESTERRLDAVPGDVDPSPAYSESLETYQFRVLEVFKGDVAESLVVHTIAGRAQWLGEKASGESYVLVLAKDSATGSEYRGEPIYLVAHNAAYSVIDGGFKAPGISGENEWSLEKLRETLGRYEQKLDTHRANSPEPPEAASDVVVAVTGALEPSDEAFPPEAEKTRDASPRSSEQLAGFEPGKAASPNEQKEYDPNQDSQNGEDDGDGTSGSDGNSGDPGFDLTILWWILGAIVILGVIVILLRK